MIVDYYWVYYLAFFASGMVFCQPMEKKENFKRKVAVIAVLAVVIGRLILCLPGRNMLIWEGIFSLLSSVAMVFILHECYEISWSVALYNMIWGVSTWQVMVEATTMLLMAQLNYFPQIKGEALFILLTYVLAYFLCGITIAKWMPVGRKKKLGPRQIGLSVGIFAIIKMLSFHPIVEGIRELPYEWGYFYLMQMLCIVVLYLEGELFKKSQLIQEKEILDFLYRTQQEQYKLSKENIALINQKCHDLKHQIRALRSAKKEELDRYLGEIEESVEIYEAIVKTGNDVLDTILTEKSLYCKKHKIQVTCVTDGSQMGFIDTIDLYAILGNAMDNAIEAVEKIKEKEKRQIDVMIYRQHNFLVVNIMNPMAEELVYEDGIPLTTKKDKTSHGFGLRSIRQILKKYEGFLTVGEEDGCFSLKMLIPVQLLKK